MTATYSAPTSLLSATRGFQGLVYSCLQDVIIKNPILGVTVIDEGTTDPKWVRLETVDLAKMVKVVQADPMANLDGIIEDGHRTEVDQIKTLPLWHVIVITQDTATLNSNQETVSFSIGFFFHHGVGDGISGASFHISFLDALNGLGIESTKVVLAEQNVISIPKSPLLPTLETKCQLPLSVWYTLKKIFTTFVYSPEDPLHWWGPLVTSAAPEQAPIVKLNSFALSHDMVQKLVTKCRSEKCTVNSLISVLIARKLALMYPTHSRFAGNIPFSLRKFTGNTDRDMGCFVSAAGLLFSSEAITPRGYISCASDSSIEASQDVNLWESARACKAYVTASASSMTDQPVGLLKFVKNDYKAYFLGMLGKKRDSAFEVTNIMVVDGGVGVNHGAQATFDRVLFSATPVKQAYPYSVMLATAKNGNMTSTLCWEEGVVENSIALELNRWLETSLREIIRT